MGWRWRMRHSASEVNAKYRDLEIMLATHGFCKFRAVSSWFLCSTRIFLLESSDGFLLDQAPVWVRFCLDSRAAEFGKDDQQAVCHGAYAPLGIWSQDVTGTNPIGCMFGILILIWMVFLYWWLLHGAYGCVWKWWLYIYNNLGLFPACLDAI